MRRLLPTLLLALTATAAAHPAAAQTEALRYSTDAEPSVQSFLAHADQITVVAPRSFLIDRIGTIRGRVDSRVIADEKVAPLIVRDTR